MSEPTGPRGTVVHDGVHAAFATPLLVKRYGDDDGLNAKLQEHILAREAKEATKGMSNVGGWHSPADLLGSSDPAILDPSASTCERCQHSCGQFPWSSWCACASVAALA